MNGLLIPFFILTTYNCCKPDNKVSSSGLQLDQLVNDGFHYNITDTVFLVSKQNI